MCRIDLGPNKKAVVERQRFAMGKKQNANNAQYLPILEEMKQHKN